MFLAAVLPAPLQPRLVRNVGAVLNALLSVLRTGCRWEDLPGDVPHERTVRSYHRRWRREGTLEEITTVLRERLPTLDGRQPEPSAAIIDRQSVKPTATGGERGFSGGKQDHRSHAPLPR